MRCICDFETESFRTLRSHFATNHNGCDFLVIFSSEIEENWTEVGRGLRRLHLLRKSGYRCVRCEFNKNRSCGSTILEIDHIDGNHQNNALSNLQVLCPNCHALTPKYRSWHNKGNKKNTDVLRPGNRDYDRRKEISKAKLDSRLKILAEKKIKKVPKKNKDDEAVSKLKEMKTQFEEDFKKEVLRFHDSSEIDFSKYGWVQILADRLEEIPQVVSKRIKRLMPDFHTQNCYTRKYDFYRRQTQKTQGSVGERFIPEVLKTSVG